MPSAEDFNRWHNGKRLCRAPNCPNSPKWPKREYCSDECYNIFIDYYLQHHTWETAKNNCLARDNYTCVLCGHSEIDEQGYRRSSFGSELEVDHIVARSIIYHVHYCLYYLPVKPQIAKKHKFWLQWCKDLDTKTNKLDNLRTLCKNCHTKKTAQDIKELKLLRKISGISEYWFYPTRKNKYYSDFSLKPRPHYDPFDDCFEKHYGISIYSIEKCDIDLNEMGKYFHDLYWTFSDPPEDWKRYHLFRKRPEYLSFVIMFESLENNGQLPSFKYLKPDPPKDPQQTLIAFVT